MNLYASKEAEWCTVLKQIKAKTMIFLFMNLHS